ncbi:transportin2-like protein [Trypanosoma rangeli]|uniref:Transportin2-like protein n=1 Tax=Trypanosoma rangeli TaxID=5698 RepID=A0A3R7N6Q2_TRYRA|nr:transportin2-like protein [Trypanosoma rangeli]RNF01142.1 transportin2-like protein [Trypanosoma rangeli]|eukprot:RNF01142.1 transportin2-like protein [Trypanosoma rangeli]
MNFEELYRPTPGDVQSVLRLLHDNGVSVQNSKKAYAELQQYQANPSFCVLLSYVFGAEACPVEGLQLDGSWIQYRRLAGITLKNNLENSKYALGLGAVKEAARCTLSVLRNPSDARIARVAAQIVVKITALTSFEWWQECGIGNIPNLLLDELFGAGNLRTLSALYTLQYLMEDLPKEVGAASKDIIDRVLTLVLNQNTEAHLQKAAFRMCFNIYEQAEQLDWNVEGLSPLQTGLTAASGTFAGVCTTLLEQGCGGDIPLLIQVLRSCVLMLEYLDYFTPMNAVEMTRLIDWWIRHTIDIVSSRVDVGEYNLPLKTIAMDLLTAALKLYDRVGGNGPISLLMEPILIMLPGLVPALVNCVPMSTEEMDVILSNDDYRMRDVTAVNYHLNEGSKDISEDMFMEDDCGAATLRASALRCIDALCIFSGKDTFPHLIEQIRVLWSADGQLKEAAIVLFGTIANGCYTEIELTVSGIVRQLIDTVLSDSEGIFVVSVAIWSLSRILEWACTCDGKILSDIMAAFVSRMQSTSKRVQQAAVSALNTAFVTGHDMGATTNLVDSFPCLTESIIACLPIYCDGNLSLLCDLALHLLAVAEDFQLTSRIGDAFKSNRMERVKHFEASYVALYIDGVPNTHVDKDIFSIDRVVAGYLTRFPDSEISFKILGMWYAALKDAVERDIRDDEDLLCNMMLTCSNFLNVTSTAVLAEWICQAQGSLASLAFQLLVTIPKKSVKSAAVTLLHRLLKSIGKSAYPNGMGDTLLVTLASSIREVDLSFDKMELVRLITLMVEVYFSDFPQDASMAFAAAVDALRSDAYNDSRWLFSQMAYDICHALDAVPGLLAQSRPEELARIMAQAENTCGKSVATIHLIDALLSAEEVAFAILPDVMRLIYSWQQAACNFPGTREKLSSMLYFYSNKHSEQLRDHLSALHPNLREMILSTYDMS